MDYRVMSVDDIDRVIPLYIDYYNTVDGSGWTRDTVYKRLHQVMSREDAYCLIAEENGEPAGFVVGYYEQYDDLFAYDLVEIVVARERQSKGLGAELMLELEKRVKAAGAPLIQLTSENDGMHEHFYMEKLGYKGVENFVLMSKWI